MLAPSAIFYLDIPPSVNRLYRNGTARKKGGEGLVGRRFLTEEGRSYKDEAILRVKNAAAHANWEYQGGRIALYVHLTFATAKARDISNCVKVMEDAIAEALGFDDSVVDLLVVYRAGVDPARPGAVVLIEETNNKPQMALRWAETLNPEYRIDRGNEALYNYLVAP